VPESVDPGPRSAAFDRVALVYDRTRGLPEKTMEKLLAVLTSELRDRGRCLEIGVGTGRLALPLAAMGIPMAGVDLSWPMLDRLRANSGGGWPFPVAMADAAFLPFRDGALGAAVAAHVLHLIPDWRAVLNEIVRVVRPGGVILADVGNWRGAGIWTVLRERFCQEAGISRPILGTQDPREVDAHMRSLGARVRTLPPIVETTTTTIREQIGSLEEGVFSFTWQVDEDDRRAAAARTETWARQLIGPVDQPHRRRRRIVVRAYDVPSPG